MAVNSFAPVNTPSTFYVYSGGGYSLSDLHDAAKVYFGDAVNMDDVVIASEYIHTQCLTYDRYDPDDYDNYLVMKLTTVTEE